ncbi:MAG: hypothetical protein KME43_08310 [Myxacorys chilensis ATA2-1-KO14]|jgi:hypothetical protein|nr:hypothetical protein [Myxacorys chilensis ATA2-1-KO14]
MAFRKNTYHQPRFGLWMRWVTISSVLGVMGLSGSVSVAQPNSTSAASVPIEKPQLALPLAEIPKRPLDTRLDPVKLRKAKLAARAENSALLQNVAKPNTKATQPNGLVQTPVLPLVQPTEATSKQEFLQQHRRDSAQRLLAPVSSSIGVVAQAAPSESTETLRQRLIIDPLVELRPPVFFPGSTVGTPTAFGANYGDAFVGLSVANRRPRVNRADGAISAGFGLGDSQRTVGLEVSANIGSLRRFARNGDIGFKLHRALPGKSAIALGWDSGITWGEENSTTVSTLYGVASKVFDLRPNDPTNTLALTTSLGVGGGRFRSFNNIRNGRGGSGVFGSVGLRVVPQASVIASWTGQDLNLGVSYVPIKTQPLFLTAVVGNVLSRNDNATLFSFGVGYGFNYAGYQY